jgi:hypothetical protein
MLKTLDPRTMGPSRAGSDMTAAAASGKGKRRPVVFFYDAFPKRIADMMAMGRTVQSERKDHVTIVFVVVAQPASSRAESQVSRSGFGIAGFR